MNPIHEKARVRGAGGKDRTHTAYRATPSSTTEFPRRRRRRASWSDYEAAKAAIGRVATNGTDYTVGIRGWLARRRL